MKPAKTVDEYLELYSGDTKQALKHLRSLIKKEAPQAEEVISYQIPLYKINKKHLIGFAGFKNHCSIFVISSEIFDLFKKELKDHKGSKTTVHFDPKTPLPDSLIKKIIKARIADLQKKV